MESLALSDQIRVLSVAASALLKQGELGRAMLFFRSALEKAKTGLAKDDPASRALAVNGNNIACALEARTHRSIDETELMILAAQTARRYWEIAGTWLETERAEYRLAQTYLKAGDPAKASVHAQACIELAQENSAEALELFFGYEALALVEKAKGNAREFKDALEQASVQFGKLSADDKSWCEDILKKI